MGAPSTTFPAGHTFPGTVYRVVRHLATGGMGSVYEVEDTTVGKRYVLKTIHPTLVARKDLVRRMEVEARALGRMSHPNVVDVITAGTTADEPPLPYFVMERLDGRNLRAVLERKGALDPRVALGIGIEMLDALAHAHQHGIVHRDVKPENVFLHRLASGLTATKLLDFGVTRLLDGPSQDTRGRFIGTLRYASPEQVGGGEVTPASDLYAAALVIYELLAGRGPFDDRSDARAVAASHVEDEAPSLAARAPWPLPARLVAVVAAALAKAPAARPPSAFAFAAELRRARDELEVSTGEATLPGALSAAPEVEAPRSAGPTHDDARPARPADDLPSTRPRGARAKAVPTPPEADPLAPTGVDRGAETRSLVADATQRLPRHGTELDVGGGFGEGEGRAHTAATLRLETASRAHAVAERPSAARWARPAGRPRPAPALVVALGAVVLGASGVAAWRFAASRVVAAADVSAPRASASPTSAPRPVASEPRAAGSALPSSPAWETPSPPASAAAAAAASSAAQTPSARRRAPLPARPTPVSSSPPEPGRLPGVDF